MNLQSTDRITVAGLPGTGKTTLIKYLASLVEPRVLIYDPLDQYTTFKDEFRYIPKEDSKAEFEAVCRRLNARSNFTFIIEEAERYLGQGETLPPNAFNLINRGRNWGVGIIACTRRVQRLSKDYFDLCQHVFFFRSGLKSRSYITEMVGKREASLVAQLPKFSFLYYNVEDESSEVATLKLGGRAHVEQMDKSKIPIKDLSE